MAIFISLTAVVVRTWFIWMMILGSYSGLELKTNEDSSDGKDLINMLKTLDSGDNLEPVLNTDDLLKILCCLYCGCEFG